MQGETIVFSRQMMTVIIEHVRLASRTIKESSGLSYNEFTLLYLLLDSSEPLSAETLADFLMIRKETASDLLLRMEDKHLIAKTPDDGDRRVMRCVLSRTGRSLTARSSAEVESALSKAFLHSMDDARRHLLIWNEMFRTCNFLRPHPLSLTPGSASSEHLFGPDYFVYWKAMVDLWSREAHESGGLSLAEYRVLDLLDELTRANPAEIAERLLLTRSAVSQAKSKLSQRELLSAAPDPFDGRGTILKISRSGAKLSGVLRKAMAAVAQSGHTGLSDDDIMMLNAWYMRMYAAYRSSRA